MGAIVKWEDKSKVTMLDDVNGFLQYLREIRNAIGALWLALIGFILAFSLTIASMAMSGIVIYGTLDHNFDITSGIYTIFGYELIMIPLVVSLGISATLEALRKIAKSSYFEKGQVTDKNTVTIISLVLIGLVLVSSIFYYYKVSKNMEIEGIKTFKTSEVGSNLIGKIKDSKSEILRLKKKINTLTNMQTIKLKPLKSTARYANKSIYKKDRGWKVYNNAEKVRKARLKHLQSLNNTISLNNKNLQKEFDNKGEYLKKFDIKLLSQEGLLVKLESEYSEKLSNVSSESGNKTFWSVLIFIIFNIMVELAILFLFRREVNNKLFELYVEKKRRGGVQTEGEEVRNGDNGVRTGDGGVRKLPHSAPYHDTPPHTTTYRPIPRHTAPYHHTPIHTQGETESENVTNYETISYVVCQITKSVRIVKGDDMTVIEHSRLLQIYHGFNITSVGFVPKGAKTNTYKNVRDIKKVSNRALSGAVLLFCELGIFVKQGRFLYVQVDYPTGNNILLDVLNTSTYQTEKEEF